MIKDIIDKKRLGKVLSAQELETIFMGYLHHEVADYQMSSLLMAICIQGMNEQEVFDLTDIFIRSGEVLHFDHIPGIKVDKHSTGGIGDKTTLVVVPIVASLGAKVVKMSGRGLGYTGGTIDKLESIPGFRIDLSSEEVEEAVEKNGAVITGQTANLVPLDKVIYALRDVTATVSSIPLIAVSIMSKKIAGGADQILLDVKYGKGALVSTLEEAEKLALLMQKIGVRYHKEVRYVLSNMDHPLGMCIGNRLEVQEAVDTLLDKTRGEFYDLCVELASNMISMSQEISQEEAQKLVKGSLSSGKAYQKFLEIIKQQGGRLEEMVIEARKVPIYSRVQGIVQDIDALGVGKLSLALGAGRKEKEDEINSNVGVVLHKRVGDSVFKEDLLMTLYVDGRSFDMPKNIFKIG